MYRRSAPQSNHVTSLPTAPSQPLELVAIAPAEKSGASVSGEELPDIPVRLGKRGCAKQRFFTEVPEYRSRQHLGHCSVYSG
jgi:hypothetical protein